MQDCHLRKEPSAACGGSENQTTGLRPMEMHPYPRLRRYFPQRGKSALRSAFGLIQYEQHFGELAACGGFFPLWCLRHHLPPRKSGGTTPRRGPSPPKAFQCIASLESPPPGETPPQAAEGVHFPRSQGGWLVFPSPAGRLYGFIIRAPLLFQGRQPRPFPLSEATQPFYTTLGTEGRKARWMPYAPLSQRRRPLREYRLAPPRQTSPTQWASTFTPAGRVIFL